MVPEFTKALKDLFEIIGLIRVLFPLTPELNELTERIYAFQSLEIGGDPFKMNLNELEEWKAKVMKSAHDITRTEFGKPIEDLLECLSKEMPKIK